MDTSDLTNPTRLFNPVLRDRLFYNQFEYSLRFYLENVSCLRDLDPDKINLVIRYRNEWRQSMNLHSWGQNSQLNRLMNSLPADRGITPESAQRLHDLADILRSVTQEFKLVISVNVGTLYTNDLALIDRLDSLAMLTKKAYSRAQVARPYNTVMLKQPQHQLRSYIRSTKLSDIQRTGLENFFNNQPDLRLSPAFARWLSVHSTWAPPYTMDHFFVDHDTVPQLTMLGLVVPGLIRKTMQIIPSNK